MTRDYIPGSDAEFLNWAEDFSAYLVAHATALGVPTADATAIQTDVTDFRDGYEMHRAAVQSATSLKEAKNAKRSSTVDAIRAVVRQIQANPSVTDAQRAALGITVPDRTPTVARSASAMSRPVAQVDTSQRLRHEISFVDEATPTSRARPAGVMGCEIFVAITDAGAAPPADPSAYTFVTLDTATPYVTEYGGHEAGKTAHYLLRWVRTGDEKGPWGETVSATIVG